MLNANRQRELTSNEVTAIKECVKEYRAEIKAKFPNKLLREDVLDLLEDYCKVVYYPLEKEANNGFHVADIPDKDGNPLTFVFINTAQTLEKQIFTAAHELGHIWRVDDYVAEKCNESRWAQAYPDIGFGVVLPRVVWDRELPRLRRELEAARQAGVTQALLGHIGQLPLARSFGLIPRGDFGLGLTNDETAAELARLGFASATASFESRLAQIRDLSKPLDLELLVYGRLPLMLMEH